MRFCATLKRVLMEWTFEAAIVMGTLASKHMTPQSRDPITSRTGAELRFCAVSQAECFLFRLL